MKNFLIQLLICLFVYSSAIFAAPDPRDSIIIESKTVNPGAGAPAVYLRVLITNKDSLSNIVLPLVERSITGGAYMILSRPRNFNGVVRPLTTTLSNYRIFVGSRYNDLSPDTVTIAGHFDPLDRATLEPPNSNRKAFWEIKFDTVRPGLGNLEVDSALIKVGDVGSWNAIYFLDRMGDIIRVNFVKGVITVQAPDPPCAIARLDLKEDKVLDMTDVVLLMNCVFLWVGDCKGVYTSADVVILLNAVFTGAAPPGGEC